MLLDEVELEQQRLGIGVGDGDFHARGLRDQRLHLRLHVARLKVGSDPALEIARLADVENLALRIEHAVNAGTARQGIDEGLRIELRQARRAGRPAARPSPGARRGRDPGVAALDRRCAAHRGSAAAVRERRRPLDDGFEHAGGQTARLGVVAAAVIGIQQHASSAQGVLGAMRESKLARRRFEARSTAACAIAPSARITRTSRTLRQLPRR